MARNKRAIPEINAGSMADIAFLLLIFYLVTTTMDTDKGINRKLPPWDEDLEQDIPPIKERNIFTVLVNSNDQLLVEDEYLEISQLREKRWNSLITTVTDLVPTVKVTRCRLVLITQIRLSFHCRTTVEHLTACM